ncbi:RPEL repeat protein [Akanthomyces lecanii RCEF 1005]|uniref:RPEL repeat protein n=1 Tax=Akanthomyces lecanii RCEF 1005 TaxID=1081108 RepID=A0A169YJG6_CORDF|nr:RPEL repeat protein [Akanthomyces lecanii RCEF 1005]
MAENEQNQSATKPVDEAPISPIERKNSLENHLQHRPDRAELVDKNILPASSAAPGLLSQQKELEKHMLGDKLNDKISNRPAPETLVKDGVLREDPRSAEERYEEAIEDEYAKREGGA